MFPVSRVPYGTTKDGKAFANEIERIWPLTIVRTFCFNKISFLAKYFVVQAWEKQHCHAPWAAGDSEQRGLWARRTNFYCWNFPEIIPNCHRTSSNHLDVLLDLWQQIPSLSTSFWLNSILQSCSRGLEHHYQRSLPLWQYSRSVFSMWMYISKLYVRFVQNWKMVDILSGFLWIFLRL